MINEAQRDQLAAAEGYDSWSAWVAEVAEEAGHPVCGEPTVKRPVRPCSRSESWGVDGEQEGPCRSHEGAAEAKRQATKRRYLQLVASGEYTLQGCAKVAGVDRRTLDRWSETDTEFASERRRAEVSRAQRRAENLADVLYRDAIQGKTKGHERIFLLKVYAASLRRRGVEPALDWDQPEKIELSGGIDTGSAKDELERKLDAIRERLDFHEEEGKPASEQKAVMDEKGSGSGSDRGGGGPPSLESSGRR